MALLNRVPLFAGAMLLTGAISFAASADQQDASPIYGVRLPADYRQWQVISVAHEAGSLNDIRVILGNDIAVAAYRNGQRPFPDGTVLVRVAWKLVPSPRNDAIFGRAQSFVAGEPTNVQVEVKNSKLYGATGGWGYGQFESGKANPDAALIGTCNACHRKLADGDDLVFTHYSP